MIDFETYHELRRCRDELGLNPVQIAAKLGLEVKTVRKWQKALRAAPSRRTAFQQARSLQRDHPCLAGKTSLQRGANPPALARRPRLHRRQIRAQ